MIIAPVNHVEKPSENMLVKKYKNLNKIMNMIGGKTCTISGALIDSTTKLKMNFLGLQRLNPTPAFGQALFQYLGRDYSRKVPSRFHKQVYINPRCICGPQLWIGK